MTSPYRHAFLKEQEEDFARRLPPYPQERWRRARACRIADPDERRSSSSGVYLPNKLIPIGLWQPATAVLVLAHTLVMIGAGAALDPPCHDFGQLVAPATIARLLPGPLHDYGGPMRAMLLRHLGAFACRVMDLDAPYLYRAAKRILAAEPPIDYSARQKAYNEYRNVAIQFDPQMAAGEEHDMETAIQSRHAAALGIAVEVATRRTELTGLERGNVTISGSRVIVVVPGRLSKTSTPQMRELSPEIGRVVAEYVMGGREFLIRRGRLRSPRDIAPTALWLGGEGQPIIPETVVMSLHRPVREVLGVTASCNLLRKAMASRSDILEAEIHEYLGQSSRSRLGNNLYANRDYGAAARDLQDLWEQWDA